MTTVHVYDHDRAESFVAPLAAALRERGQLAADWRRADVCIIASDRCEAMRHALEVYEAGIPIWQWGAPDKCEGDQYHYDGLYRDLISRLAARVYSMRPILHTNGKLFSCCLGPPHVDALPDTSARPFEARYALLCTNPLPWRDELVPPAPRDVAALAMWPGSDAGQRGITGLVQQLGWTLLTRMPRARFLRWVRHAEYVIGNSSLLTYEAPIWHPDADIIHCGLRNKGRGIVRWDVVRWGSPTANMLAQIEAYSAQIFI